MHTIRSVHYSWVPCFVASRRMDHDCAEALDCIPNTIWLLPRRYQKLCLNRLGIVIIAPWGWG